MNGKPYPKLLLTQGSTDVYEQGAVRNYAETMDVIIQALETELIETREQRDKAEYDRTYAIGGIKTLLRELGEGTRCTRSHPIDQFCEGCSPSDATAKQ